MPEPTVVRGPGMGPANPADADRGPSSRSTFWAGYDIVDYPEESERATRQEQVDAFVEYQQRPDIEPRAAILARETAEPAQFHTEVPEGDESGYGGPTDPITVEETIDSDADAYSAAQDVDEGDASVPGVPTTLTLAPATVTASRAAGDTTLTATVLNADGDPAEGVEVTFSVAGVTTEPDETVVTDAAGEADFAFTGDANGVDTVTAYAEGVSDTSTVTWTA